MSATGTAQAGWPPSYTPTLGSIIPVTQGREKAAPSLGHTARLKLSQDQAPGPMQPSPFLILGAGVMELPLVLAARPREDTGSLGEESMLWAPPGE